MCKLNVTRFMPLFTAVWPWCFLVPPAGACHLKSTAVLGKDDEARRSYITTSRLMTSRQNWLSFTQDQLRFENPYVTLIRKTHLTVSQGNGSNPMSRGCYGSLFQIPPRLHSWQPLGLPH